VVLFLVTVWCMQMPFLYVCVVSLNRLNASVRFTTHFSFSVVHTSHAFNHAASPLVCKALSRGDERSPLTYTHPSCCIHRHLQRRHVETCDARIRTMSAKTRITRQLPSVDEQMNAVPEMAQLVGVFMT
jgi:hypothetical protein